MQVLLWLRAPLVFVSHAQRRKCIISGVKTVCWKGIREGRILMSFNKGKPQWCTIARAEVKYLDMQGNPVEPEDAAREITIEYDDKGNVICTLLKIDFDKIREK